MVARELFGKNQISPNKSFQHLLKFIYENFMYISDFYHARKGT